MDAQAAAELATKLVGALPRERQVNQLERAFTLLGHSLAAVPNPEGDYLITPEARSALAYLLHEDKLSIVSLAFDEREAAIVQDSSRPLHKRGALGELEFSPRLDDDPQGPCYRTRWTFKLPDGEPVVIIGQVSIDLDTPDEAERFARRVAGRLGWSP